MEVSTRPDPQIQDFKFRLHSIVEEKCESSERLPKARSGHRIVYHNGRIYSFGGYNPAILEDDPDMDEDPFWLESMPLLKELWEFNLATRVWRKAHVSGDIPDRLASHAACMHPAFRGCMVLYGGTGSPFGSATSSTVVICKLDTATFKRIPMLQSNEEPGGLYGQSIVIDQAGCLYTIGGTTAFQYFMDVNKIDLMSPHPMWQKLNNQSDENEPCSRYRHEICLHKGNLLVLGGGRSISVCGFQSIPTFSLEHRSWSYTQTEPDKTATIDMGDGDGFPDARRCHGLVQFQNQAWVIGGYDGSDIFADIWKLDLDTFHWKRLDIQLPTPVYFHGVTISEEGQLFIFGGVDNIAENSRTNKIYSTWLRVPSLRCLCWEAVKHYVPNIEVHTNRLRELGVPGDYIESVVNDCDISEDEEEEYESAESGCENAAADYSNESKLFVNKRR